MANRGKTLSTVLLCIAYTCIHVPAAGRKHQTVVILKVVQQGGIRVLEQLDQRLPLLFHHLRRVLLVHSVLCSTLTCSSTYRWNWWSRAADCDCTTLWDIELLSTACIPVLILSKTQFASQVQHGCHRAARQALAALAAKTIGIGCCRHHLHVDKQRPRHC